MNCFLCFATCFYSCFPAIICALLFLSPSHPPQLGSYFRFFFSQLCAAPSPGPGLLSNTRPAVVCPFFVFHVGSSFFVFWLFLKLLCGVSPWLWQEHHRISRVTPTSVTWHGRSPALTHSRRIDHNTDLFVRYYYSITLRSVTPRNDYKRSRRHFLTVIRVNWPATCCVVLITLLLSRDAPVSAQGSDIIGYRTVRLDRCCWQRNWTYPWHWKCQFYLNIQNSSSRINKQPITYFQW